MHCVVHQFGVLLIMKCKVDLKAVEKDLRKAPKEILVKFRHWVLTVELLGIFEAQGVKAWKDHGLKGNKAGRRAISLNYKWRAEYTIENGEIIIVRVLEVHPHAY